MAGKKRIYVDGDRCATTFLCDSQVEWLKENLPSAVIKKIRHPSAKYSPAFKLGMWNGLVDKIQFETPSDLMLFLLRWK
jgi:hypothetical protein